MMSWLSILAGARELPLLNNLFRLAKNTKEWKEYLENHINYRKSKSKCIEETVELKELTIIINDKNHQAIKKLKKYIKIKSEISALIIEADKELKTAIYYQKQQK